MGDEDALNGVAPCGRKAGKQKVTLRLCASIKSLPILDVLAEKPQFF